MSNIYELETNIKAEAAKIDLERLTKKLGEIEILYNGIVPLINEAVLAASNKSNFEEAYKAVIDKLREIHERVSEQKQVWAQKRWNLRNQRQNYLKLLKHIKNSVC